MAKTPQRTPLLRNRGTYVGLATLTVGVTICVVLVRELGAEALRAHLVVLAPTLPTLLALELLRFLSELMSTRLVLSPWGASDVPRMALLRGQCLAHACNKVMPAGRAVGEGLKAAVLAPSVGAGRAIGVGAACQIMTLLVNGAFVLMASAVALVALDRPSEAGILGGYGAAAVALGVLVVVSLRSRLIARLLSRVRFTLSLRDTFAQAAAHGSGFGPAAIAWHALAKVAQTVQLGVLLAAVGAGVRPGVALVAEGVQIVGAAAGDLVPAQLGATEGAFTLAAGTLGLTGQEALSVAALLHGSQLMFAAAIMLLGFLLKPFTEAAPESGRAPTSHAAHPAVSPRRREPPHASAPLRPEPVERAEARATSNQQARLKGV